MMTRKNHLVFAILLVVLSVIPTTVNVQRVVVKEQITG